MILGKKATRERVIDGCQLQTVWWVEVGVFILEVREHDNCEFSGSVYGVGRTVTLAKVSKEQARDWVEQEAKLRAREMAELAKG